MMISIQEITYRQNVASILLNAAKTFFYLLIRIPALLFDLPICCFARKISNKERQKMLEVLESGDILLTTDKLFPLWEFLAAFLGSPNYSHAAIYEGEERVIEATTFHPSLQGVAQTAVQDFLSGRKKVCLIRPPFRSVEDKNAMMTWLRQQTGKPFDFYFRLEGENAMYCSKLVAKAMKVAGFKVNIKRKFRREGYVPDAFLQMENANIVYQKMETSVEKMLTYLSLVFALLVCIAGIAPWWTVCLALFGIGGLQLVTKL